MTAVRAGLLVTVFAVAAAVALPAAAQTPPATPPPGDAGALRPGEIQRLFDAYVVMEAQQALGLTDQQFAPFVTRLRALQDTRRRHQAARAALLADLGRLTNPRDPGPADDAAIRTQMTALQELESRSAAELRRAYGELDTLLAPRQQARFRVFEDQLERRKLELMLRARQNARQQRLQQWRR